MQCDYTTPGGVIVEDVRWYLGLRGLILPGKGLGIEQIEIDSPADFAGLKQGMIITQVNGVPMIDEAAMAQVIERSGGILEMDVLDKLDGKIVPVTVRMKRLVISSY